MLCYITKLYMYKVYKVLTICELSVMIEPSTLNKVIEMSDSAQALFEKLAWHQTQMIDLCATLNVGMSKKLPEYADVDMLRNLFASNANHAEKRFFVERCDDKSVLVGRLQDNIGIGFVYKTDGAVKQMEQELQVTKYSKKQDAKLKEVFEQYLDSGFDAANKYDAKLTQDQFYADGISYLYIQRKTSPYTFFYKDEGGATEALKRAIERAVAAGILVHARETGRKGEMFRIILEMLK